MTTTSGEVGAIAAAPPAGSLIRCAQCGTHRLAGSTSRCRTCLETLGEFVDATATVTLHSVTEIHRSFPGFDTPFLLGWVDHPTGVRLLCRIDGIDADSATTGTPLALIDQPALAESGEIAYSCQPIPVA